MLDAQYDKKPLSFVLMRRTFVYPSSMALQLPGPDCQDVEVRVSVVKLKIATIHLGIRRVASIIM